jgi:hypothetical protein
VMVPHTVVEAVVVGMSSALTGVVPVVVADIVVGMIPDLRGVDPVVVIAVAPALVPDPVPRCSPM